jgi:hypothetical protein
MICHLSSMSMPAHRSPESHQRKSAAGKLIRCRGLAARELAVEQREREVSAQIVVAEQGHWLTRLPRPLFAFAFVIYAWKVVVWDKVLGAWTHGVTDPLGGDVARWAMVVLTAYFGGRSLEKVAKILRK